MGSISAKILLNYKNIHLIVCEIIQNLCKNRAFGSNNSKLSLVTPVYCRELLSVEKVLFMKGKVTPLKFIEKD